MYRIPKDICIEGVLGHATTQLRIGQFDLQFTFGDVDFNIESEVELFRNSECIGLWDGASCLSAEFHEIMNSNAVKYSVPDDRTLVIYLENGIEIHIKDSCDQFECIQITWGKKQWII